jgi:hypothetical protein
MKILSQGRVIDCWMIAASSELGVTSYVIRCKILLKNNSFKVLWDFEIDAKAQVESCSLLITVGC